MTGRKQRSKLFRSRRRGGTTDFQIQVASLALARWDALTPYEQQRFRSLAHAAEGHAKANLPLDDYRELRAIWKKLETRRLIAEAAKLRVKLRRPESPAIGS